MLRWLEGKIVAKSQALDFRVSLPVPDAAACGMLAHESDDDEVAGLDAAQAGDTVLVHAGVYHEALTLDVSGVTLLGVSENGARPVLDGRNILSDGLVGSCSKFEMRNFEVRNYTANGLMINRASGVTFREIHCDNPGLYGLYPVECLNVLVERCSVTGAPALNHGRARACATASWHKFVFRSSSGSPACTPS